MTDTKQPPPDDSPPIAWLFGLSALLRLVVVAPLHEPVIFADETAPMLMARALLGQHPTPTMGRDVFYHVGYALLVAPWTALFGASGAWRAATFGNALLLASMGPLVYLIARDTLRATPTLSFASAIAVSLYPAFVLEAGFTWAESAVLPLVLLTFVLCQRMVKQPSIWRATAFGCAAAAGYTVHPRLVPMLVLAPVALLLANRWHGLSAPAAIAGLLSAAALFVATRALHAWLQTTLYVGTPGTDEHAVVTRIFTSPLNLWRALLAFAGQSWYLGVATFGLAPLGAWLLVQEVRKSPRRVDLLYLVGSIAALIAVSSLFVIDPKRVDQRIYGRYVETFLAVLLAAGVVAFGRRRAYRERIVAMLVLPIGLAAFLLGTVGPSKFEGVVNVANLLGIDHFGVRDSRVDVVAITGAAVAGAAILLIVRVGLRRWGASVALVIVAVLFGTAVAHTERSVIVPIHETRRQTSLMPGAIHRIERLAGVDIRTIDIAYEPGKNGGEFFGYQFLLPKVEFRPFDREAVPPGPWVLAAKSWPAGERAGARLVYPEGLRVDEALWVLPGADQEQLEEHGIASSAEIPLSARDLRSTITPDRPSLSLRRGIVDVPKLKVTVAQRGKRPWPSAVDPTGTFVRVRAEWYTPDNPSLVVWENLGDLPYRMLPGEAADVTIDVKTVGTDGSMPKTGRYYVRFAMVQGDGEPVRANGPRVTIDVR